MAHFPLRTPNHVNPMALKVLKVKVFITQLSDSLRPSRLTRQGPLLMGFSRQAYWSG